jgi:hypothetical protein
MKQLTTEQIKTLEDAFVSYPEDFPTTSNYASMEGIQTQLNQLKDDIGRIYYISKVSKNQKVNAYNFTMNAMEVGIQERDTNDKTNN